MTRLITFLLLLGTVFSASGAFSEVPESCAGEDIHIGRSLLAVRTSSKIAEDILTFTMLPGSLQNLGISLFGSEAKVVEFLNNTKVVPVTYSEVDMRLAMTKDDDAAVRFGGDGENGEEYGLDSLLSVENDVEAAFEKRRDEGTGMINMIDMGGNLGVITIAVFKRYPGIVRCVAVEPVPTTYFYMELNFWLNNVPKLITGTKSPQAGVMGIQKAISPDANFNLQFCLPGNSCSMNAHIVTDDWPCNTPATGGTDTVSTVTSITIDSIFEVFGNEDITFVKMDCEACEHDALPAMEKYKTRVRRLGGEMHMMPPETFQYVCAYNQGRYLTGMCEKPGRPPARYNGVELCEICK
mmetsp:Transcript_3404/g.6683  ORF Transcript_3404/g.6683 Transcript_3404/m.6683 type:complete len:353 (+) Transcript_3404:97-1155(+)